MKQVLFSGVLSGTSGPSVVNRAYTARSSDWLIAPMEHPGWRVLATLVRRRRTFTAVLVSGISGHNIVLLLTARMLLLPTWYLAHGMAKVETALNGSRSRTHRLYHLLVERLTLILAARCIAVSETHRSQLIAALGIDPRRVLVAANAVDSPTEAGGERPSSVEPVRIMTVGMAPLKNVDVLVEAVREIAFSPIELVVVGPGLLGGSLPGVAVVQFEQLAHEQVLEWMARSHIYVQISTHEPFGLAVCEAATQGCDLLISQFVGASDVIPTLEVRNVVADPRNRTEVSEKLAALIADAARGGSVRHSVTRSWDEATVELRRMLEAS